MKANRKPQRDNNLDDIIKDDNFAKEHLGNIPKDKIDGLDIIVIDAINTNPDDDHIEDLAPPCIPAITPCSKSLQPNTTYRAADAYRLSTMPSATKTAV